MMDSIVKKKIHKKPNLRAYLSERKQQGPESSHTTHWYCTLATLHTPRLHQTRQSLPGGPEGASKTNGRQWCRDLRRIDFPPNLLARCTYVGDLLVPPAALPPLC